MQDKKRKSKSYIPKELKMWIKKLWDKYWAIIIAIIAGVIIGKFILPKFFG